MITSMISQLKDLHSRDKAESAKIHKYQQRTEAETDEDFKDNALSMLQKVTDVNTVTKDNIKIYRGKVKAVVEEMVKIHNDVVMESDSRKRKDSLEAKPSKAKP